MVHELEGRIIPVHIGRPDRTSPGKELGLHTVSGAHVSSYSFRGFWSREDSLCKVGLSIYGGVKTRSDSIFCSSCILIRAGISITQGALKNIHAEAPHRPAKFEWVGGAEMNLENLPGESNRCPGLKTSALCLWFLNFCGNQNDLKMSVNLISGL